MTSVSEGVFIRLSSREAEDLFSAVEEAGFSKDAEGVKLLLFSLLAEPEETEPDLARAVRDYLQSNPAHAAAVKAGAGKLFEMLRKKL